MAKKAAAYLSKELKTRVEVKSLYLKPFKSLVLEGLYVEDLDKDTLLYTPRLTVDANQFSIKERKISITTAQLDSGKFFLKTYKNGSTNIQFIVNYFKTGTPRPATKPKAKPYDITFGKIVLNNLGFKYRNYNRNNALKRINFDDIDLYNLNTTVLNLDTKSHLFKAQVNNLTFREKSGFYLRNLTTDATVDSNQMEFKKLLLQTNNSEIRDYVLLKYGEFRDFMHFVDKVYVKAGVKNSVIHTKDIAFFTDAAKKMNLSIRFGGQVSGYVKNIHARNFNASAGQATYVKGDFDLKGLPNINKTYLDLRFTQAHSNKKDAERLTKLFTGKAYSLPPIAAKFGNVNFSGSFRGFTNDFSARGEVKTALGRLYSDLRMNLAGTPRYSGIVKAFDFNLGAITGRKDLGRTTLTAKVNGTGFSLEKLQENIDAQASYFDYKGYRYSNLDIHGSYHRDIFDGRIRINDKNIRLNFNGGINFSRTLPEFNFVATVRGANLRRLGFIKDTLIIDADFRTNFTGNNLNNVQGNLELRRIKMKGPQKSMLVESVDLVASGTGSSRSLYIRSDILDVGIRGQYDLENLPWYFTSVVKQYIPSLKVKTKKSGVQNFDFELKLKYFEPLEALLFPSLKIPEGASFNGKFVSTDNTATLTGSSPQIVYKGIKINNFILDESTTATALNLFLTADRIDLTDKIYIQNINVANILRNDSLALNVKLSDKDAINQLDLNGLVEFGSDTLARFSLLPSDVVINREVWRIQEKVRLKLDQEKIFIEGFELFRDDQLLTINGVLSNDPTDILNAEFKQFKLSTFNSLTSGSGVNLAGNMNGSLAVSAITKHPKVESDITVDSLVMNNTSIGDLTLTANLDNETRLIDLEMNILKEGKETLFASGTYNANASESNKLNLDLVMNNSELIVFQPFLKSLVSNLSGNISAQIKVTGRLLDPTINGTASLNNAGLTINYTKAPYWISDDLIISNSIIRLDELALRDKDGHKATAYGSVDMRNPRIPLIDVNIRANNFMALNTTAKDNPLYYGVAYGTGTYSFTGPTNNMRISIDAKTEPNTVFYIPLNSAETVGNSDLVTYVNNDSTVSPRKTQSFNGLVMDLNLVVDEATEVNIITDLGRLKGRGNSSNLTMNITSAGDFRMYGDYLINSGRFEYTAQDYINKIFEISGGGSIRWTGDPADASINLKAIYELKTNLRNLYIAARGQSSENNNVLADAVLNIKGTLSQPEPSFDIYFPNDAYVRDELQSYFSDVNNLNTQALSLIVRRSFSPNTGFNESLVLNTAAQAGTEFFFNQVNNILSQSLNLKTVDINIRSLNDASASIRLLKERLVINGGVSQNQLATQRTINDFSFFNGAISRDVELLYLIKKDGSLTARASNRLNTRNVLSLNRDNQEYVSALGLVYRNDFDNFGEFLRSFVRKTRTEDRQLPSPIIPATPAPASTAPTSSTQLPPNPPANKSAGR